MSAAPDVVIVGAGIAGAACARALLERGLRVQVLERGRVAGGRMATRRFDERRCDLGAAYFTVRDERFGAVVTGWERRGLARAWTTRLHVREGGGAREAPPGPMRWAAPGGLRGLVVDLLEGLPVTLEREVVSVEAGPDGRPRVDGLAVRAVVLAMPDPQADRLLGDSLPDVRAQVIGRAWEPALALAARFARRTWSFEGLFVNDDAALRFVADDGRRRGDDAPVLVGHSTAEFARHFLSAPERAAPALVEALRRVTGAAQPVSTFVHRWGFARPAAPRQAAFFLGSELVGLCGDGWGEPRVEAAWVSGDALGRALADRLQGR